MTPTPTPTTGVVVIVAAAAAIAVTALLLKTAPRPPSNRRSCWKALWRTGKPRATTDSPLFRRCDAGVLAAAAPDRRRRLANGGARCILHDRATGPN